MAERAAGYLAEDGGRRLVVLAGTGHTVRSAIPRRVVRRVPVSATIVLQGDYGDAHADEGDFRLASDPIDLPKAGLLGVLLESREGGVTVAGFSDDSAAEDAGIEEGDRIVELDGSAVRGLVDVKLSMLGKRPGDTVSVVVAPATGDPTARRLDVMLR